MNYLLSITIILATCITTCISSTEAISISCHDNACEDYDKVSGMKCCKYQNLVSDEFEFKNITTTNYHYNRLSKQTYSLDIQQFIITNSNISIIPKNLFQSIFDLIYLDIINSGVRNILVSDFFGASKLVHLNLTNNSIQTLEPKLFVHAQNLLYLDLSYNDISHLSEYAFDHLDNLQKLILSNNKLIVFQTNQRFTNLEVFRIDNNLLNEIGQEIFQNSSKLREMNLSNNNIYIHHLLLPGDIILDTFDISNNLAAISINSKQISIKNTNTSMYLVRRNVEILDASNNQIVNIEFESSTHLTKINLSNNNLTSIRNVTHLNNLQQLDLSFNSIKDFSISSFSEMNVLTVLNLKKSGLPSLDFGTFSQQTNLISLDISDNNLKKINFDTLLFMSSLSLLHIDGNQLTNIDISDIKGILPNLTAISISRNLFKCHDLISILKTLNSYKINTNTNDQHIVKNSSNVRGISCFSDTLEQKSETLPANSTNAFIFSDSNLILDEKLNELNHKVNISITESKKEMLFLKDRLEDRLKSLSNQIERSLNEQVKNLSSLRSELLSLYNSNSNFTMHTAGSDSFQFAFMFLVIILILFACGVSLFFYFKFRVSTKKRWYTAAKHNSTSADQTLV